jgi:hypothetical protein
MPLGSTAPEPPNEGHSSNRFLTRETGLVHELWGTGFFVAPRLIMSAKHVLCVTVPDGQVLAAIRMFGGQPQPIAIRSVYADPEFDIAVAPLDAWGSDEHLVLADTDTLHMNRAVLTVEYSPTQQNVDLPDGRKSMVLDANWHQGHVVRDYLGVLSVA